MALPKYVWPVVAVVLGGGAILLSSREPVGPGDRPIIRTPEGYQREYGIARELTFPVFAKANAGQEVTAKDRENLRKALPHLEAMNAYAPVKVGPFFAIGQIHQLNGDVEAAGRAYEQAIANEPVDLEEKKNPAMRQTVVEAKALLSEVLLEYAIRRAQSGAKPAELKPVRERALAWADAAVKAQPAAPRYLAAKASALLALERQEEAKKAVLDAAAADSEHFKVKPLMSLVGL